MLLEILQLIVGIIILVKSSDFIVKKAINLAARSGLSEFFIGFVLVGFATSLPEFFVTIVSAFENKAILGTSTLFGSSITDITLTLGLAAFFSVIYFSKSNKIQMSRALFISSLVAVTAIVIGNTGLIFGIFCISIFYLYMEFFVKDNAKIIRKKKHKDGILLDSILIIAGVLILVFSAHIITGAAVGLSGFLEITFIGGVIIAIGSALPELAVTVNSIRKKDITLIISNIAGSLVVNTTLILGIGSLIHPTVFSFDMMKIALFMIIANIVLWLSMRNEKMTLKHSFIHLLLFALYIYMVFI